MHAWINQKKSTKEKIISSDAASHRLIKIKREVTSVPPGNGKQYRKLILLKFLMKTQKKLMLIKQKKYER